MSKVTTSRARKSPSFTCIVGQQLITCHLPSKVVRMPTWHDQLFKMRFLNRLAIFWHSFTSIGWDHICRSTSHKAFKAWWPLTIIISTCSVRMTRWTLDSCWMVTGGFQYLTTFTFEILAVALTILRAKFSKYDSREKYCLFSALKNPRSSKFYLVDPFLWMSSSKIFSLFEILCLHLKTASSHNIGASCSEK